MSKIAIKGHTTRGSEVIELLKMLGGVNWHGCAGNRLVSAYYISESGSILFDDTYNIVFEDGIKEFITFTLEEFLDKYPYKVDDKIRYNAKNGNIGDIISMVWDESINDIIYTVAFSHGYKELTVDKIIPYKEETNMKINKCTQCVYAVNNNHCGLRGFRSNFNVNYCSAQNIDKLPNGFELQEDGYFSWVNKKPKYPISYEECCTYLGLQHCGLTIDLPFNYSPLFISLAQLYICRNAYWKIAGEKMGLDKSWEPDWKDDSDKYFICYLKNELWMSNIRDCNRFLVFPTEEMRDAFYDNFKDLIECCKELL